MTAALTVTVIVLLWAFGLVWPVVRLCGLSRDLEEHQVGRRR